MPTFREEVVAFARTGLTRATQCHNEECTKLYLVLPFLRLLGYDPNDPQQVAAEHSADFSERYKNRVDFLLKASGEGAIALECKPCGADLAEDRGQLKSYFNAISGGRIGGLTNGLEYEFFINSAEPNIMDDEPFLAFSLKSFANGEVRPDEIEVLENLSRGRLSAEQIVSQARRRLLKEDLKRQFQSELKSPSEELCRLFLQRANRTYVRSSAITSTYRGLIKGAIEEVLAKQIWNHFRTQKQLDVSVRAEESGASPGIETTDRELYIFGYCQRQLAFLVQQDATLFEKIEDVGYKDFTSKFVVFYKRVNSGRLFEFYEGDDGRDFFVFSNELGEFEIGDDLERLDQPLLTIFRTRVRELAAQ